MGLTGDSTEHLKNLRQRLLARYPTIGLLRVFARDVLGASALELPDGTASPVEYSDSLVRIAQAQNLLHSIEECLRLAVSSDVAILCPLPLELNAVLRHLGPATSVTDGSNTFHLGKWTTSSGKQIAIATSCPSDYGNLAAQAFASRIVRKFNPTYLCVVGVCGGIATRKQPVAKGDLLVPSKVLYYELAKDRVPYTFVDKLYDTSPSLIQRMKALEAGDRLNGFRRRVVVQHPSRNPIPQLRRHLGCTVASGEKVLDNHSSRLMTHLRNSQFRVLGIEMESAGVAGHLAYCPTEEGRAQLLIIRCVSDLADGTKDKRWQPYCADVAAAYLFEFLDMV
jgi:nucleoside phosphorylase